MNNIAAKQNEPRMLRLLRARRSIYSRAKTYQATFLGIGVILPICGVIAIGTGDRLEATAAFVALIIGFCEAYWFDRRHKSELSKAAKLQEEFDCHVLDMEWNNFLVGSMVDPEDVSKDACKELSPLKEAGLRDWYPLAVNNLPLHLARLVCQRTNLRYDGELRKRYSQYLRAGIVAAVSIGALVGIAMDLTFTSIVLAILAPATPLVLWVARELNRQADTVELLGELKNEVDKLWVQARAGAPEPEISERSRELQDAIYNHRVNSPLIFDWIYYLLRNTLEREMNAGAEHWVAELRGSGQS